MFSSNIGPDEVSRRICDFRVRAEAGIEESECINEVLSVFGDVYSFPFEMKEFVTGTKFFRVRPITDGDTEIPLSTLRTVSDAWEPPPAAVRVQGRLNAIGQSVLYCCANDPDLAIDEARARDRNFVATMVYQSTRPVKVSILGNYQRSGLPKDFMSEKFFSFLDEEFGRYVSQGQEARYSITRAIAETFFNYPEQDAWCYRSVQSPEKFNTAFFASRLRLCLQLSGVLICDLRSSHPGKLDVKAVVDFDETSGEARYHPIGSDRQKLLFPEID